MPLTPSTLCAELVRLMPEGAKIRVNKGGDCCTYQVELRGRFCRWSFYKEELVGAHIDGGGQPCAHAQFSDPMTAAEAIAWLEGK